MGRIPSLSNLSSKNGLFLWHWFIAVLIVGQVFQHFAFQLIGGVTKDNPFSGPLIGLYGVAASVILYRLFRSGGLLVYLSPRGVKILALSLLLGILLAIGLTYTPAPGYGLSKTVGYVAFNLGPSVFIFFLIRDEHDMLRLLKAILIVGILSTLVVILATLQLSGSFRSMGGVWDTKGYFYVLGTKVDLGIWFGRRMALLTVTALALTRLFQRKKYQWIARFLVVAFGYLLILAGARGPFYFGMMVLAITAYFLAESKILKRVFVFCSVGIAVFIIGKNIFYNPLVSTLSYLPVPVEIRERYGVPLEDPAGSWVIRSDFYKSAVDVFMENIIHGVGTGGWAYTRYGFDVRDYPHNIFLEIASELGLLGLVVFCMFLGLLCRAAIVALKRRGRSPSLYLLGVWGLGVTLIGFFNAQTSGDIQLNEYIWVGGAILAKVATWSEMYKKHRSAGPMYTYRWFEFPVEGKP